MKQQNIGLVNTFRNIYFRVWFVELGPDGLGGGNRRRRRSEGEMGDGARQGARRISVVEERVAASWGAGDGGRFIVSSISMKKHQPQISEHCSHIWLCEPGRGDPAADTDGADGAMAIRRRVGRGRRRALY